MLRTAYRICWLCDGSGHGPDMSGDPDGICWECNGGGVTRIRDKHGRFATEPLPYATQQRGDSDA
jgi:hypothetical protein